MARRFTAEAIERFWREQNARRRSLRRELDASRLPYAIAVENLSKDWNLGNLVRTANAFLCGEIVLVGGGTFDRVGSGRIERFERIRHFRDQDGFLAYVRESGYSLVAVEIGARAKLLGQFSYPARPMFLFGGELEGLSQELMSHASDQVMIPQYGLIPCLNVSVSCSIVLYDYVSRNYPDLTPAPVEGSKFRLNRGSGQSGCDRDV